MPKATSKAAITTEKGLVIERRFTSPGVHPYDELEWETRDALIGDPEKPAFEQRDVEFPKSWSQNATNIVAQKYFRGQPGSPERESSVKQMVSRVAESIFIPFTVGGGIRSAADAGAALRAGADKVTVNTAAVRDPGLVSRLADSFGSQCVVAAVDVKRVEGRLTVVVNGGREPTELEAVEWSRRLEDLGAGEILLTSMDRDGTGAGYDLELLAPATAAASIPVIASGGAGRLEHLAEAFEAGAHGVLAATIFHFQGSTLPEARAYLRARGYPVRP